MTEAHDNPRLLKLTPNFLLGEFLPAEDALSDSALEPWILDNLYRLANRLQVLRDILGKPVTVSSGYRTQAHNKAVGGHPNSYHQYGMAADIIVREIPASEVQKLLKNWHGGLGAYAGFTHLDIRPHRARWRG